MDKKQGELLADLVSTPNFGVLWWSRRTFDWYKAYPDKIYDRHTNHYVDALIVEGNVAKMAATLRQDKERIERWLKRFEEYKEKYPIPCGKVSKLVKGT